MSNHTTWKTFAAKAAICLLLLQLSPVASFGAQPAGGQTVSLADLVPWDAAKSGNGLSFRSTFLSGERDYVFTLKGQELQYQDLWQLDEQGTVSFAELAERSKVTLLSQSEDGSFTASYAMEGPFGEEIRYLMSSRPTADGKANHLSLTLPDHSRTLELLVDAGDLAMVSDAKCELLCAIVIVAIVVVGAATAVGCSMGASSQAASCVEGCGAGNVSSMSTGTCGVNGECECQDK